MQEMLETWVRSLGREDLLQDEMAIHSSILAWRIPRTEEPGGLPSMGLQRVGCDWVPEEASRQWTTIPKTIPPTPALHPCKNYLPRHRFLVPKRLGTAAGWTFRWWGMFYRVGNLVEANRLYHSASYWIIFKYWRGHVLMLMVSDTDQGSRWTRSSEGWIPAGQAISSLRSVSFCLPCV